jgi:hypothetical protein
VNWTIPWKVNSCLEMFIGRLVAVGWCCLLSTRITFKSSSTLVFFNLRKPNYHNAWFLSIGKKKITLTHMAKRKSRRHESLVSVLSKNICPPMSAEWGNQGIQQNSTWCKGNSLEVRGTFDPSRPPAFALAYISSFTRLALKCLYLICM